MSSNDSKSYTDCVFKLNFLISPNTFSDVEGVAQVAVTTVDHNLEPNEATCKVIVSDTEENDENSPSPSKKHKASSPQRKSTARTLKTRFDIENIPNFLQLLVEDETIGWPKPAFIRLIHVINQTYDIVGKDYANMYVALVASQINVVSSDDRFSTECYIHPEEIKKYRKDRKDRNSLPTTQYYRTNYNVDCSLSKMTAILIKFFDLYHFLSLNRDVKVGNYKINASDKAEVSGSRKSLRAKKSLPQAS